MKANQPGLYAQVKNLPWRHVPAGCKRDRIGKEPRQLDEAASTSWSSRHSANYPGA